MHLQKPAPPTLELQNLQHQRVPQDRGALESKTNESEAFGLSDTAMLVMGESADTELAAPTTYTNQPPTPDGC